MKCNGRHHVSICNKVEERRSDISDIVTQVNVTGNILLQTAKAELENTFSSEKVWSRLMFDSGSQRSYVSSKVRNSLRTEKIIIKTFGNDDSKLQTLEVVQFKVKNRFNDSYVFVETLSVPKICSPLRNQNVLLAREKFGHLSKLDLADFCDGSEDMGVGVLVGIYFGYSFLAGKVIKSDHGPVACHSNLGWVLSGTVSSVESCSFHCFEIHTMKCEMQRVGVEGDEDLRALLTKFWEVESVGDTSDDCVIHKFYDLSIR